MRQWKLQRLLAEVDEHIGKGTIVKNSHRIPVLILYNSHCVKHSHLPVIRLILRKIIGLLKKKIMHKKIRGGSENKSQPSPKIILPVATFRQISVISQ